MYPPLATVSALFRRHASAVDLDAGQAARQRIQCPNCGLTQFGADCTRREITFCCRCGTPLVRRVFKSLEATLACSIAILLLSIPAMLEPFLTTSAFGTTRTSVLPMSATFLWREGWPLLALLVCLFIMVFPAVRFLALTAVLLAIRSGRRPAWLGCVFRVANALQTWTMLGVFLLGMAVAYARLRVSINVSIDIGAVCFIAAAVLSLFVRASLDKAQVWRLIAPDDDSPSPATIACMHCGLLIPAARRGRRCPRCTAVLHERRPDSIMRSSALVIAAALFYLPANLYPIATIPIDVTPTAYTVIGGVFDLAESHLIGLALLVFSASFAIPLLKMAGLSWFITSVLRRSNRGLLAKTRIYRIIEELGRWSMVDPLTIACFVPVLHFNGLIDGRAIHGGHGRDLPEATRPACARGGGRASGDGPVEHPGVLTEDGRELDAPDQDARRRRPDARGLSRPAPRSIDPRKEARPLNPRPKFLSAIAALAAALTACQSAPTRLYTLYSVAPAAPRSAYAGAPLRVDAVHFPPSLDRIEIVRDIAPGELRLSDVDQWSAPLGQAARQALSADLAARLPPAKFIFPHLAKPEGSLGVTVDVLDFKADGQGASLEAGWVVSAAGRTSASRAGSATLRSDAPATNAAATAQALSALLGQLADRIVAAL